MLLTKTPRKKIVFLGTPEVVCVVLNELLKRARAHSELILVVTQPPARSSRSQQLIPSPVQEFAYENGIPVLSPLSVKEPDFLKDLGCCEPDLCITAAYGQYLPSQFLKIPKLGTINIHPSLLPRYRGAAPVQRSLENGDKVSGVSLLYTVKEMDAGPILAQEKYQVPLDVTSPQMLKELFILGARMLVDILPDLYAGKLNPEPQNSDDACHASKLSAEESFIHPNFLTALQCHNKIRAFQPWPMAKINFIIDGKIVECKLLSSKIEENRALNVGEVHINQKEILIGCAQNTTLGILELQPAGKKAMCTADFLNGLRNKSITIQNNT